MNFACFRTCMRDSGGVAAIDFAVMAGLLMLIFILLTDLGLGVSAKMQVENAAQYGAQYAFNNGYDASAIQSAVESSSNLAELNVTPTSFCGCPGGSGVTSQSDCATPCGDGSTPGEFVSVLVTHTYVPILPYPGLQSGYALSSQSTVRLK